jgi:hypothetical protein
VSARFDRAVIREIQPPLHRRLVLHGDTTGKVMLNASLNLSILPSLKVDKKVRCTFAKSDDPPQAVSVSLISYGNVRSLPWT